MRLALGIAYRGQAYAGWQSQPGGNTVQDHLESALSHFAAVPIRTLCAGRTDAGVHGLNQVVHLDAPVEREPFSWVRGTNRYLPPDIAVQWCREVDDSFHARNSARGRRYTYVLLESPVRPAIEQGAAGWVFRALQAEPMRDAAQVLLGEHDFSSFRSAECQAASPVKELRAITIARHGAYWRFDFDGSAFLHHMVRNMMGCLVAIGSGQRPADWMREVLAARSRDAAAPTFAAAGLYFVGPYYDASLDLPAHTPAIDWLPHA
ncbi:tRNA pseudouridine(38-40) synthase TruA [Piscinibacter sp. HJYY11]|uniref:tRNA pseudouridine(38-40) synthase TruA n=1 Tax=Piscinibacter sp. HJYY11 TaxID=2801333 RepID=UPI00191D4C73|nr:tRNA pseudouridine(38-40) synthase TruA [Piscinibacter sp. HJYY11]MBL0727317.1 tRNA pseudouridine(38-40) synthase TruA [Piscinibacter sp. HJYY11]